MKCEIDAAFRGQTDQDAVHARFDGRIAKVARHEDFAVRLDRERFDLGSTEGRVESEIHGSIRIQAHQSRDVGLSGGPEKPGDNDPAVGGNGQRAHSRQLHAGVDSVGQEFCIDQSGGLGPRQGGCRRRAAVEGSRGFQATGARLS